MVFLSWIDWGPTAALSKLRKLKTLALAVTTASPCWKDAPVKGLGETGTLRKWTVPSHTKLVKAEPLAIAFPTDSWRVTFRDVEGGKPPLKYVWKFGDGTPDATDPSPKHTYEKAGKYRADLTVADGGGDSDSDYIEIEVH